MRAYTGAKVRGGKLAFDAAGFAHKRRVPILLQHDPEKRAGFADKVEVRDGQLHVEGYLLSNSVGRGIASDSDDGFPFEASVGLNDIEWQHLDAGDTAELNGDTVEGPLSIGRRARLAEVSFVTAGADSNTHAVALEGRNTTTQEDDMSTEKLAAAEAALADSQALLAERDAQLSAAQAQLEAAETRLAAFVEAEAQRKRAEADAYVDELADFAANLQSPIPAEDLDKVRAQFDAGNADLAKTLGEAFRSRSQALASTAAQEGAREVSLGAAAGESSDDYLARMLKAEGIDPTNPKRLSAL